MALTAVQSVFEALGADKGLGFANELECAREDDSYFCALGGYCPFPCSEDDPDRQTKANAAANELGLRLTDIRRGMIPETVRIESKRRSKKMRSTRVVEVEQFSDEEDDIVVERHRERRFSKSIKTETQSRPRFDWAEDCMGRSTGYSTPAPGYNTVGYSNQQYQMNPHQSASHGSFAVPQVNIPVWEIPDSAFVPVHTRSNVPPVSACPPVSNQNRLIPQQTMTVPVSALGTNPIPAIQTQEPIVPMPPSRPASELGARPRTADTRFNLNQETESQEDNHSRITAMFDGSSMSESVSTGILRSEKMDEC